MDFFLLNLLVYSYSLTKNLCQGMYFPEILIIDFQLTIVFQNFSQSVPLQF